MGTTSNIKSVPSKEYWVNGYEIFFEPCLLSGGEGSNSREMSKPQPIGAPLSESGAKQPIDAM